MRLSARNQLKGTIRKITHGAINSEVVIEIAPGIAKPSGPLRTRSMPYGRGGRETLAQACPSILCSVWLKPTRKTGNRETSNV